MKRSSQSAEPENDRTKATRRQEAVSCEFCRKKKLKCDRLANCSNCRARKLPCSIAIDASENTGGLGSASFGVNVSSSQSLEQLDSRLKRLEDLLASQSHVNEDTPSLEINKDVSEDDGELSRIVSLMETDDFERIPSLSHSTNCSETRATLAENFASFFCSLTEPRHSRSLEHNLASMLPLRKQGEILLNYYFENADWIYRILHVPTVRRIFNDLYTKLEHDQHPSYSHLALISTIFALSAFFCSPSSGLYLDRAAAVAHSRSLILFAQDVLAADNCLAKPSIETLQSLIMITQWLMPNIVAIATLRTLAATLMHTARSLSLHLIDSPANKKWRTQNQVDWAEVEVKRRIWWHITSTDWLLSFMGGAQNGTYMIHPKQMNVDLPSNVNDSAINSRGNYAQPDDIATEMTFFRFRCRGTALFREIIDAAWEAGCDTGSLPYQTVLEFDKKFNDIIREFESIFANVQNVLAIQQAGDPRGRPESTTRIYGSTKLRPYRNMARFCMDSRFARLHRPYLVRGAKDLKYAYSRMVCLRSARSIMELGNTIMTTSKDLITFKVWAINHHMYIATVILVMDYCFNRNEPRAKERKVEILECFEVLKRNNEGRTMIPGLQKLEKILRDAAGETDNEIGTYATRWGARAIDASVGSSHQQDTLPTKPIERKAEHSSHLMAPLYEHTVSVPRDISNDATSQQTWLGFDFNLLENTHFDGNLDTSLFDELFQNLDSNNDLV